MSQLANAIRFLSADAVQKANSGHPGAPMGMAEMAEVLWTKFLRHNPANPKFYNHDRFVLSNGHASMLLYSLLHLTGYNLSIEDLKNFRQLHSKTPGHPEYGYTDGVETTTGPLGQGIANAVGMALAEKILAAEFNKDGLNIVDHYTYVFMGDGCLMEGVSHEACSLAGTLGLGKLIVLYDDNNISIDGKVDGWFTENIPQRFESYGWHVVPNVNGHDTAAIQAAIEAARAETGKPSIICCKTLIGKGSANKEGSHKTHGAPLGADEIEATRKHLGWTYPAFEIPQEIYAAWDAKEKGAKLEADWNELFAQYQAKYPAEAAEFVRRMDKKLPDNFDEYVQAALKEVCAKAETIATRKASQNSIEILAKELPELVGGSADLTGPNKTKIDADGVYSAENRKGRMIEFGIREFAMSAISAGISLHGGLRPFCATFLVFSDYLRPSLRVVSLMKQPVIYVFTHDSIYVGEDGPTHQPVETLASLRAIPGVQVLRPGDAEETVEAWKMAYESKDHPVCLALTRQKLTVYEKADKDWKKTIRTGAYVVQEGSAVPDITVLASGSEVNTALEAAKLVPEKKIRIVSVIDLKRFSEADDAVRNKIIGNAKRVVAAEAGIGTEWFRFVKDRSDIFCIERFGESGPAEKVAEHLHFTASDLAKLLKR
mgnify:CR=1 FL=1